MNKRKKVKAQLMYCLCSLLLECLDELKSTTQRMLKFRDDLIGFCEELNNEVADTNVIQRGTYFQELSKKIDTLIRKNYEE